MGGWLTVTGVSGQKRVNEAVSFDILADDPVRVQTMNVSEGNAAKTMFLMHVIS